MIPGLGQMMSGGAGDEEAGGKMKRMMYITDSMTQVELDSDGSLFYTPIRDRKAEAAAAAEKALAAPEGSKDAAKKKAKKPKGPVKMNARARRVAKGSGTSVREVEEFLAQVSGLILCLVACLVNSHILARSTR